jgi:dTDP-4-dehydrorhamnose 3,5-epimerase
MLKNGYGQYLMQVLAREGVPMKLTPPTCPSVLVLEPRVFGDAAAGSWKAGTSVSSMRPAGAGPAGARYTFVQDNHSRSARGVLRGLHYQLPAACPGQAGARGSRGGLRRGGGHPPLRPRFGRWVGVELSADNHRQLWIPEGFAHGFLALEDDTHFLYKTTDVYARDCERALRWDDATLGIAWPLQGRAPRVAPKDAAAPLLADAAAQLFER